MTIYILFIVHCNAIFHLPQNLSVLFRPNQLGDQQSPKHLYEKIIWNESKKGEFDKKFNERIYPFYEDLETFSATDMLENFISMIKFCCSMNTYKGK